VVLVTHDLDIAEASRILRMKTVRCVGYLLPEHDFLYRGATRADATRRCERV
jgi:hypothetical protein